MAKEREDVAEYEATDDEVMDEVEQEIELLDQDYIDESDGGDDDISKEPTAAQAAEQQRIESLKSRLEGGETETAEALKEVTQQLRELRSQPQSEQKQETVEDLQALKKKLADGFYDNPMDVVDTWIDKRLEKYERERLQPAFTQMAGVVRDTALDGSKRSAGQDDIGKFVMENYTDEVEQLIQRGEIQVGPGAYQQAVNRVAANHMSEIIQKQVQDQIAAQQEAADDEQVRKSPARGANPSRGGSAPRPSSNVQVTRGAQQAIYSMADKIGADRTAFFNSYVRNHPDKVRELNRGRR